MKSLVTKAFTLFIVANIYSCTPRQQKNNAEITFATTEYDFGELEYKEKGNCSFQFNNPGKVPLVIHEVKTSCGCTVPEWPREPIKAGKSGDIRINYDTSHPGVFSKTITIFYNGEKSPETLTIKGNVKYPDDFVSSFEKKESTE